MSCCAPRRASDRERLLEAVPVDAVDDLAVHLDRGGGSESCAKRALPVVRARPSTASSFRPRLRIVSIIPGIETAAPERTDTSSGSSGSPKRLPARSSSRAMCSAISSSSPSGRPPVAHVRAAGVGRDREARRHGNAELRHLGEPDALAAEQLAAARRTARRSRRRTASWAQILSYVHDDPRRSSASGGFPTPRCSSYVLAARARPPGARRPRPRAREYGDAARASPASRHDALVLSVAAGRPARARARARRDPRRRRQHGEHARGLARARVRPDPARGVGGRRRPHRLERRDDLLVRGRRDGLVRPAARGDARRARLPARERVPALRRRGAAPARVHASSSRTASRAGHRARRRAAAHYDGTELVDGRRRRRGRGGYRVGPTARCRSTVACSSAALRARNSASHATARSPSQIGVSRT